MKIIHNILQIEKNVKSPPKIKVGSVGPHKLGSVGFQETIHFVLF